jgi:hypothetical protein
MVMFMFVYAAMLPSSWLDVDVQLGGSALRETGVFWASAGRTLLQLKDVFVMGESPVLGVGDVLKTTSSAVMVASDQDSGAFEGLEVDTAVAHEETEIYTQVRLTFAVHFKVPACSHPQQIVHAIE